MCGRDIEQRKYTGRLMIGAVEDLMAMSDETIYKILEDEQEPAFRRAVARVITKCLIGDELP